MQSMIGWRVTRGSPCGTPLQLSREWVPSRRLGWQASIQGERGDMLDKHAFPVNAIESVRKVDEEGPAPVAGT